MMKSSIQRLEFIDLMKGICILTVVVRHLYGQLFPGQLGVIIYSVQVPVFFYLSGILESKRINKIENSLVKFINKILIPYIFWFTICIIIFLPFKYFSFWDENYHGNASLFSKLKIFLLTPNKHLITNYPCWFLLGLFEIKLLSFIIDKSFIKFNINAVVKYVLIGALVIIVYYMCLNNVKLPFSISSAIINLPFYYLGRFSRDTILKNEVRQKYKIPFIIVSVISCVLLFLFMEKFDSNNCIVPSNILFTYFLITGGILVLYTISLLINNLTLVNYLGSNSLVLLVTHVIIFNMLPSKLPSYLLLIITICLSIIMIPLSNRFLPFFVGKKDIINNKF